MFTEFDTMIPGSGKDSPVSNAGCYSRPLQGPNVATMARPCPWAILLSSEEDRYATRYRSRSSFSLHDGNDGKPLRYSMYIPHTYKVLRRLGVGYVFIMIK